MVLPTPYSDIYDKFLLKVRNYSFLTLDQVTLEALLRKYLGNSISKFRFKCKSDLVDRNDILNQFNQDVEDDEQEILSLYMLTEYLNGEIVRDELIKQNFTNREWSMTSQANHMDQMIKLKEHFIKEIKDAIRMYTFNRGNLSNLN